MAPWYGMDGIQECSLCHEGEWHGMFKRFVRPAEPAKLNAADVKSAGNGSEAGVET